MLVRDIPRFTGLRHFVLRFKLRPLGGVVFQEYIIRGNIRIDQHRQPVRGYAQVREPDLGQTLLQFAVRNRSYTDKAGQNMFKLAHQ